MHTVLSFYKATIARRGASLLAGVVAAVLLAPHSAAALEPTVPDFSLKKPGGLLDALPTDAKVLTSFGERPVFSPDGKKVAFIGESLGDAFEYDLATGVTRNLTAHTPHRGFFRVHYLPDGSYVLTGARKRGTAENERGEAEIFYLDKNASGPIQPLDARLWEGLATARSSNTIAWAEYDDKFSFRALSPASKVRGTLKVADVVVSDGRARLANIKSIASFDAMADCLFEAQDFRANDTEVIGPCYVVNKSVLEAVASGKAPWEGLLGGNRTIGVIRASGKRTEYFSTSTMYAELEGVSPDGKWALVECAKRFGAGLDLCRIELTSPASASIRRITFAQDYGPYRYSNATISPDARWMAFHVANAQAELGTGSGIVVAPLK